MLFGVGVPVSIKARSYWPAATAALVGTMLDFAYGYNFACAEMVDNYRRAAEVNCVRQSVTVSQSVSGNAAFLLTLLLTRLCRLCIIYCSWLPLGLGLPECTARRRRPLSFQDHRNRQYRR